MAPWKKPEKMFSGRKGGRGPPIKTVRIETLTWDSGGGQKRTKSDDGWLTAIDKFYHNNSVGLISAKYRSDAK